MREFQFFESIIEKQIFFTHSEYIFPLYSCIKTHAIYETGNCKYFSTEALFVAVKYFATILKGPLKVFLMQNYFVFMV
jgi:hypothetical protein